jgi:hypothetical protein
MSGWDDDLDKGDQGERIVEPDQPFPDEPDTGAGGDRGIEVRGPGASVARARSFTTYTPTGMCLNFVWNCLAAPRRFGLSDANAAWTKATERRKGTDVPAGAPVYWAGGRHGHIAISVGGGRVRSTDWPRKGSVGEVDIDVMTRTWGITYRGWSADYAGALIPGLGSPTVLAPSKPSHGVIDDEAIRPGKRNGAVRRFNKVLWDSMPADYRRAHEKAWMGESADLYGPVAQQVCFDRYALLNKKDAKKWPLPTKPVWPGPGLLRWLGFTADRAVEAPTEPDASEPVDAAAGSPGA